jgi:hypothetical protein
LAIDRWVDDRYSRFYEGVAFSASRVRLTYLAQTWLGDCPFKISYTALDLLNQQHQRFLGTLPNPLHREGHTLPPCTGHTARQHGLICAHEMARRHENKEAVLVHASDIHLYWHLKKTQFDDSIVTVRSPPKAVPKGRPRGVGGPFGTEEALPRPPGPTTASQTGIAAAGRRIYSSWERSGPDLEALDDADSLGTQSSVPGIDLGTPMPSSSIITSEPACMASPEPMPVPGRSVPASAHKRAASESPGRGGFHMRLRHD